MAFGMGFDKAKVMSAAEKYVGQGKIPAAIEEYRKVLSHDKKDLTILNTVADLCVRVGKNEEALKHFFQLAELCLESGLTLRAIATYKRITKVNPDSVEALLKLGELYSMQGLLRDARGHYLQVVEYYTAHGEREKARDVFEKILMLDMENPLLQSRMAELYAGTGKKAEAISTYLGAANRYLERKQPDEAIAAIQALLAQDNENVEARTLLGRAQLDQGFADQAAKTLQAIPGMENNSETLRLLIQVYEQLGESAKARKAAEQLFEAHHDFSALAGIAEQSRSQGQLDEAFELYRTYSEKLLAQRPPDALIRGMRQMLASTPSHVGALELLLRAYRAAGNLNEVRETSELLAHAYRTQGEFEKAREVYRDLVSQEPENPDHAHLLRQVEVQMGIEHAEPEAAPEPAAAMLGDLSEAAKEEPPPAPVLPEREQQLVKNCITEAELYITYYQFERAIEAVEGGLAELPGNTTLLEQLLALFEKSNQYGKAADTCEALTEAYVKQGDGERAARYGEMLVNFRQKAEGTGQKEQGSAASTEETLEWESALQATATPQTESPEDASAMAPPPVEEEPQVREVDLSMEWASVSGTEEAGAPAGADASLVEEIEFYIQAGLTADATATLQRLETGSPENPAIPGFRERLGLGAKAAGTVEEIETGFAAESGVSEAAAAEEVSVFDLDSSAESETAAPAFAVEPEAAEPAFALEPLEAAPSVLDSPMPAGEQTQAPESLPEPVWDASAVPEFDSAPAAASAETVPLATFEEELPTMEPAAPSGDFELSLDEEEAAPPHAPPPPPPPPAAPPADPFASLAGDLAGELAGDFEEGLTAPSKEPASATPPATPSAAKPAAAAKASSAFDDIFADFKAEMEEVTSAEDPETHYNMGVAFKEMALYDEAIGEFQKAHQIAAKAGDFSHVVQYCSLLATCFLEKGLPQIAVKWYQTALDSPGLDPESVLAFLYELGSAQESAGDAAAALKSFLDVYARNIDYRDVSTRIRSLQQSQ